MFCLRDKFFINDSGDSGPPAVRNERWKLLLFTRTLYIVGFVVLRWRCLLLRTAVATPKTTDTAPPSRFLLRVRPVPAQSLLTIVCPPGGHCRYELYNFKYRPVVSTSERTGWLFQVAAFLRKKTADKGPRRDHAHPRNICM